MNRSPIFYLVSVASVMIINSSFAHAQLQLERETTDAAKANVEKQRANDFIRMQRAADKTPLTLQTAIATFRPKRSQNNLQVDLIGAVHVGDQEYYQQLNKLFEQYDVVLYELVAPKGTRIPKGGRSGGSNPISMLQGMTKDVLNLASQTEAIDYTKQNLVHADMSPTDMSNAMKARGDTPITVALSAMSEMMRQANVREERLAQSGESALASQTIDPFSMLLDPQRDTKLKIMMAEQFSQMGTDLMGPSINRLLVEDRNKAAMKVLQKEIVNGHKRIGIFYGAAHLPDFEQRLVDLGMTRSSVRWLTAWDLQKPSKNAGKANDPVQSLFRALLGPN